MISPEVYPELNVPGSAPNNVYSKVMGPDTHGVVRTLGKGASLSLVYSIVYKRSQAKKGILIHGLSWKFKKLPQL